ncbi:MAG: hypothetical protein ACLRFR_02270 [Clostridia bacterium]
MKQDKAHAEAAIIGYIRQVLFYMFKNKDGIEIIVRYNCALAVLQYWNNLHKRNQINLQELIETALNTHNLIYKSNITAEDFSVQLNTIKSIFPQVKL